MPTLTRYYIKTALIYFIIAITLNVLLSARTILNLPSEIGAYRIIYVHLLTVGWLTQLIFGVINWMFPKYSKEHPRGNEKLGWLTYITLNIGLCLRAIGEPLLTIEPTYNTGWIVALSAILQFIAIWGFIINTWARVRER